MAYRDPGSRWRWLRRRRAFPPLRPGFVVVVVAVCAVGATALLVATRMPPGPGLVLALGGVVWSVLFAARIVQDTFAWVDVHDRGIELVRPFSRHRIAFDDVVSMRGGADESRTWVDRTVTLSLRSGDTVTLHGGQIDEEVDLVAIVDRGLRVEDGARA